MIVNKLPFLFSILLLTACGTAAPITETKKKWIPLTDVLAWQQDNEKSREFTGGACSLNSFRVETGRVELDLTLCNPVVVFQPIAEALESGDRLLVEVYYRDLYSEDSATATIKLFFEDKTLWQKVISIPRRGDLIVEEFIVDEPVAAGSKIYFSVENHGVNNYSLVRFEKQVTE